MKVIPNVFRKIRMHQMRNKLSGNTAEAFFIQQSSRSLSECHGLGEISEFDLDKIIPDKSLSISQGAILTHLPKYTYFYQHFISLANHFNFSLDTQWQDYDMKIKI